MKCPTCQTEMTYLHASNMDGRLFHCRQCGHLKAQDSHFDTDVVPAQAKNYSTLRKALKALADKVDKHSECDHKRVACEDIGCIGVEVKTARAALDLTDERKTR
jgi:transcription initiation factor IIE alpha subunit